jgi:hypothetical protein
MRPLSKGKIMSKETLKKTMSSIGKGLDVVLTATHNSPLRSRIYEIEEEIAKLQAEKAELEERLV